MIVYPGRTIFDGAFARRCPRWLLGLALLCAMLFAPLGMAAACAHQPNAGQTARHCARSGDTGQHAPVKQFQCMGTCSTAIDVGATRLAARLASRPAMAPIPTASSLAGILLERDTPPPRLS